MDCEPAAGGVSLVWGVACYDNQTGWQISVPRSQGAVGDLSPLQTLPFPHQHRYLRSHPSCLSAETNISWCYASRAPLLTKLSGRSQLLLLCSSGCYRSWQSQANPMEALLPRVWWNALPLRIYHDLLLVYCPRARLLCCCFILSDHVIGKSPKFQPNCCESCHGQKDPETIVIPWAVTLSTVVAVSLPSKSGRHCIVALHQNSVCCCIPAKNYSTSTYQGSLLQSNAVLSARPETHARLRHRPGLRT